MSNNQLITGSLDSLFNKNTSYTLEYVVFFSMSLHGTLPDKLFQLPALKTLVLSSNCITGSIPTSICSSNVQYLILDGIGASSNCQKMKNALAGTIPSCMLSSTNMTTLQLSGNGLYGSIPDMGLGSLLQQLNFASNLLTGTTCVTLHIFILHTYDNIL